MLSSDYLVSRKRVFTTLDVDATRFAIAQDSVAGFVLGSDITPDTSGGASFGVLAAGGTSLPVFSMNPWLEPRSGSDVDDGLRYCIALRCRDGRSFALTCQGVGQLLSDTCPEPESVPDAMRVDGSPVDGLLWVEDRATFVLDTDRLLDHLSSGGAAHA